MFNHSLCPSNATCISEYDSNRRNNVPIAVSAPEKKVTLSQLDKYQIYGKFPLKMVIHALLIVFMTI